MLIAARVGVIAGLADCGVSHVEYVAALPDPDVWVWLGTDTDAQRDNLAHADDLLARVRELLVSHGVVGVNATGVTVQSAETVARDYEGSWFYALR